ncbi:hypothetical protein MHSWG343_06820 [Candidatus Mycoplasma haematohominis]|uniref:Uncharacterized protein n=1 Tax=Candidatus Mycoplasma haematohominis TaxID=1494318 RepID=A0A478FQP6_9MOLU|nr:hypothetical protein MHSWG343_06820 [Candidatus Mycoplasma haemohominis]
MAPPSELAEDKSSKANPEGQSDEQKAQEASPPEPQAEGEPSSTGQQSGSPGATDVDPCKDIQKIVEKINEQKVEFSGLMELSRNMNTLNQCIKQKESESPQS